MYECNFDNIISNNLITLYIYFFKYNNLIVSTILKLHLSVDKCMLKCSVVVQLAKVAWNFSSISLKISAILAIPKLQGARVASGKWLYYSGYKFQLNDMKARMGD